MLRRLTLLALCGLLFVGIGAVGSLAIEPGCEVLDSGVKNGYQLAAGSSADPDGAPAQENASPAPAVAIDPDGFTRT